MSPSNRADKELSALRPDDIWVNMELWWNYTGTGEPKTLDKDLSQRHFVQPHELIWMRARILRDEKPDTNRLGNGTAIVCCTQLYITVMGTESTSYREPKASICNNCVLAIKCSFSVSEEQFLVALCPSVYLCHVLIRHYVPSISGLTKYEPS
jgi:hypothetical protein